MILDWVWFSDICEKPDHGYDAHPVSTPKKWSGFRGESSSKPTFLHGFHVSFEGSVGGYPTDGVIMFTSAQWAQVFTMEWLYFQGCLGMVSEISAVEKLLKYWILDV